MLGKASLARFAICVMLMTITVELRSGSGDRRTLAWSSGLLGPVADP